MHKSYNQYQDKIYNYRESPLINRQKIKSPQQFEKYDPYNHNKSYYY